MVRDGGSRSLVAQLLHALLRSRVPAVPDHGVDVQLHLSGIYWLRWPMMGGGGHFGGYLPTFFWKISELFTNLRRTREMLSNSEKIRKILIKILQNRYEQ